MRTIARYVMTGAALLGCALPAGAQDSFGNPPPTPTTIPGGRVVSTEALWSLLQTNPQGLVIFDVLGGAETLPNALAAVPASQPGSYSDQTQQQFGQYLQQLTGGNRQAPLVFYCLSRECWMSYNAALRAIAMGYSQVLWYRGGVEAWKAAGLPTSSAYPNPSGGALPMEPPGGRPY